MLNAYSSDNYNTKRCDVTAGHDNTSQGSRKTNNYFTVYGWFIRNESKLLRVNVVSMTVLIALHIFTISIHVLSPIMLDVLQIVTLALVGLIFLSVAWKGMVPIIICVMGITLIHAAILIPVYYTPTEQTYTFKNNSITVILSEQSITMGAQMFFFLGMAMVVFSMIVAYKPSMLFTKNRPETLDSAWSKYPVWQDNVKLEGNYDEPSVPITRLMTDQDRYLLWRYEYVLVSIYGTQHLVKPNGMVPIKSEIIRDKESGRVMGKARFTGFFV